MATNQFLDCVFGNTQIGPKSYNSLYFFPTHFIISLSLVTLKKLLLSNLINHFSIKKIDIIVNNNIKTCKSVDLLKIFKMVFLEKSFRELSRTFQVHYQNCEGD